jgi:hypothetical protein
MRIRNPGWEKFGSGMEKSRIRDKHPGSAILFLRQLAIVVSKFIFCAAKDFNDAKIIIITN